MGRDLSDFVRRNLRKAISRHEIQVYYQPVIRTFSQKLCSFEALARWIDPELGMIYPDEFIPVLEQERIIHLLDAAVLRQVCARLRSSITNGEAPIPVSVNLSRLDFSLCDIFSVADDIVSDYQLPHDLIYFEITESVMAEETELLRGIVDRFRAAGYQVWMDDFGSAYSSLNALKELSFDELKLDMGFLRPFNTRSRRIATAVVKMAKDIEIHTLVEGVETEEQFSYLRNIGCEKVQGFYFGRPQPYQAALANLAAQGIGIEAPQDRSYYDEIGRIDVLSAVPFMTRSEHDAVVSARQLNSIPLALGEFRQESFSILFYNSAFEEIAADTGITSVILSQEALGRPQPYRRLTNKLYALADSVKNGGEGRMLATFHESYYEIQVRCMARTRDRYCALIRITNLSKSGQAESTGQLDEAIRRIYALFERITLVNIPADSIRPLYTTVRLDLVSGRKGVRALLEEYAEKYLFPEDREKYLRLFDPAAAAQRLAEPGRSSFSEILRTSTRHGQYAWKEYTMLRIDGENYFLLIRDVHERMRSLFHGTDPAPGEDGTWSAAGLWNALVRSDLLRLFWKDSDRRFRGASKAFLEYYGFESPEELLGKNDEELGWHIHPDKYMNDELRVIHEGATIHNIPGLCMNEGENREILASKTPLYDPNGEIQGLLGYFIDRELLTANDKRGKDTSRRDMLTGLLNSRGVSEEAARFRDEYYLRGVDFVRIHIFINDFTPLNEHYGFDFGDKVLGSLGKALKRGFGRTCVVGRYSGSSFVVLHQVEQPEEARDFREKIKAIGRSIRRVNEVPLTLYLSVGYVLFSEAPDLKEQAHLCEVRLHADHDISFSAESRIAHASEIFRLFDDLPLSYSVYHLTRSEHSGEYDAVIFYVNHKFEEYGGESAKQVIGHSVRELYPHITEEWFENVRRAAMDGQVVEGATVEGPDGKRYRFTARQILYTGYCAVTYLEE